MSPSGLKPILVSACLLGLNTRYNNCCKKNDQVLSWLADGNWVPLPVCPEQLGGLPTPRPKAEYQSGDGETILDNQGQIHNGAGQDLSPALRQGAEQTLTIAQLSHCRFALLKERSPSCGVHAVYRNGAIVEGRGATSALLTRHGIRVFCEEDLVAGNGPEPDNHG